MAVKVLIPTPLQRYVQDTESLEFQGVTVEEILQKIQATHRDLAKQLFDENGKLRQFVNVFVGEEDIRYLKKEKTALKGNEVITIIPSIAGGGSAGSPHSASVEEEVTLSKDEILRYSRHLIIPDIGMRGQLALKKAKVLLVGTGGLGSPLGLYLAAAGVGTIGLIDFDVVDFTNLQRQIAYNTQDVGRPKVEAAAERLKGVNPNVQFKNFNTKLSSQNALDIMQDFDIIVDGTDNFPTRYLVNDACVLLGKPNVYGSIFRFDGQVSVFYAKEGPCYRCLFPVPPPPGMVPSCAEGGVLGVLPGIIGTLQALETVKLITGAGKPMVGRLLLFDGLKLGFRELKLRKNPECPICSEHPTLKGLIDYDEFCGIRQEEEKLHLGKEWEIEPKDTKKLMEGGQPVYLLDVREDYEWDICHLEGARLIPLGELPARVHELNSADFIVAYCRSGNRSARAVEFLKQAGFRKVKNMTGGILAWADDVDPSLPTY